MAKDNIGLRKKWTSLVRTVKAPWSQGTEPLEIRQAILEEVAEKVVAVGHDNRIFPFNHLRLHLYSRKEDDRVIATAAFEAWDLPAQIRERLAELRCNVADLTVELVLEAKKIAALRERPFFIEYQQIKRRAASAEIPELVLTVLKGRTAKDVHRFRQRRVLIGRLALVLDENGAPKRRNDLAFEDAADKVNEDKVNETVSRAHARITYRSDEHGYTLTDERSSYGTRIFRGGREIAVPSRDRRGIRLRSGDLLYFGQAEVKCTIRARARRDDDG